MDRLIKKGIEPLNNDTSKGMKKYTYDDGKIMNKLFMTIVCDDLNMLERIFMGQTFKAR